MKTILVAMVTFHKQLFMKLDSLLLLLSPPVHTLHLPMFHERVVYETEHRRPESDESSPSATYMRLVTIDVTRIHLAGVRVNAVPEPGHLDSRLLASSENLSKRGIGMVIW